MVDGPTEVTDLDLTEANRSLVRSFVETVLLDGQLDRITDFIQSDGFSDHNPTSADGTSALRLALENKTNGARRIDYKHIHRVLAQGNFVLCASEGQRGGIHSAFYDLFRVANGMIVEHWDTTESIAPRSEWKNTNGKF